MDSVKNILLVEDDPSDIELILMALGECELAKNTEVTRDGEDALDYLYRRNRFSSRLEGNPILIILDIKMPKVDGIQVLQNIKSNPKFSSIPVVVLTSSRENKDLKECYELGANSYVVKPIQFNEFVNAVKNLGIFWTFINEPPYGSIHASRVLRT